MDQLLLHLQYTKISSAINPVSINMVAEVLLEVTPLKLLDMEMKTDKIIG